MKNAVMMIALPVALLGCQKKAEAPTNSMTNMAMPAEAKMGSGTGEVTAIDKAAGKITLDHGAIPAVGWPAMTMAFSAKPELFEGLAVGDKVAFDITVTGSSGTITKIAKN